MNRYMITREKIKGQEYLISALYDEKKHMIEVLPEAAGETSLLGNIYVGKVENIVTNLNAAFGQDSAGYTVLSAAVRCEESRFYQKAVADKGACGGR